MGEFMPRILLESSVALGPGATVAMLNSQDLEGYDEIRGVVSSDQDGTLTIRQGADALDVSLGAVPQNFIASALAYVNPNMVSVLFAGVPLRIDGRWVFVSYTNGGVAQARFRLSVWALQVGT